MDALMLPLNWQRVRLGTYKYRRGSFPQPYGNPQWYSDNGMPFVQVYDVGENFKLTQKTKQKISKIAQPMSVFVPKNSVIITLQGTIGRVALTQYDCYCDRTILIFDNNTLNDVNKYFFVLSLFTKFEEEKRKADGSIIKTITKQTLKDFEIFLPPLNEQIAIANILSDLDHYLCSLDALILKKESVKKALSFELLSQRKRLKGFNQAWQRVRLGTYKYRRGSFPQPYGNPQWYSDNGMPFVQVYDVGENFKLTQRTKQKISKIAQPMSVFVPKNSVIITLQGTIGRVALTQYDCYCDRTILIFDNNTLNDVNKYFFVLSLFTKFEEEKRKADGSIIKTITKQT
ncbi:restriction endonuclease subunit S, partial [Helicobacter pylori]|uniref:restriction endonuclease subunit S n=1 Tax=Helicobacter pylori TaxID=210 RepID=UPI0036F4338C